jgi:hypothetical protein
VGPPGQGHCQICKDKQDVREKTRKKKEKKQAAKGIVTERKKAAREREHAPKRKESKKRRREENPEKKRKYDKKSRKKRREQDEEGYLAKNAENAMHWRKNNPEMVLVHRYNARLPTKSRLFRESAAARQIAVELPDELLQQMLEDGVCFFCGDDDTSVYLMSIFQLDITKDFTETNSIPPAARVRP